MADGSLLPAEARIPEQLTPREKIKKGMHKVLNGAGTVAILAASAAAPAVAYVWKTEGAQAFFPKNNIAVQSEGQDPEIRPLKADDGTEIVLPKSSPDIQQEKRTYTIQPGDTLSEIAARDGVYQTDEAWKAWRDAVLKLNPTITDDDEITAGEELVLPPLPFSSQSR